MASGNRPIFLRQITIRGTNFCSLNTTSLNTVLHSLSYVYNENICPCIHLYRKYAQFSLLMFCIDRYYICILPKLLYVIKQFFTFNLSKKRKMCNLFICRLLSIYSTSGWHSGGFQTSTIHENVHAYR